MDFITSFAVLLVTVSLCTAIHYEVIRLFDARFRKREGMLRKHVPLVVGAVILAHLAEIILFALAFWVSAHVLNLGSFSGGKPSQPNEYFALAAESYTSFGYGDIIPSGWLRFIVSVTPLTGLLLLAWSGAFLYGVIHRQQVDGGRSSEDS